MNSPDYGGTGEHQNGRTAMDSLIKSQVASGVPHAKAQAKAKEVALRHDRKKNR